ncbi:MAG: DUF4410 domain-containing protein [Dehalococcoidia bacterium]|nr:DUF4410 domain-containing protein [Dehalococcoidia bacterium]
MDYKGKDCLVETWRLEAAKVKASFDVMNVTTEFHTVLKNKLSNEGLSVVATSADAQIVVRGRFVCIDEGSRLWRYLLPFFAGKPVIEMEGELIVNGSRVAKLSVTEKRIGGFFGGESKTLLKSCGKTAAQKVAKQVVAGLRNA